MPVISCSCLAKGKGKGKKWEMERGCLLCVKFKTNETKSNSDRMSRHFESRQRYDPGRNLV